MGKKKLMKLLLTIVTLLGLSGLICVNAGTIVSHADTESYTDSTTGITSHVDSDEGTLSMVCTNGVPTIVTTNDDGEIVVYKDGNSNGEIDSSDTAVKLNSSGSKSLEKSSTLAIMGTATEDITGDINITIINAPSITVIGADSGTKITGNVNITVEDSLTVQVFGVNKNANVTGDVNITATGTSFIISYGVYTGAYAGGDVNVKLQDKSYGVIYGSFMGAVGGDVNITHHGSTSTAYPTYAVYGANSEYDTTVGGSINVDVKDITLALLVGAQGESSVGYPSVGGGINITATNITFNAPIYGAANTTSVGGDIDVNISGSTFSTAPAYIAYMSTSSFVPEYGGDIKCTVTDSIGNLLYGVYSITSSASTVKGSVDIEVSGCTFAAPVYGCFYGTVEEDVTVKMSNTYAANGLMAIYGSTVGGNATVTMDGGSTCYNTATCINNSKISGNADITLDGVTQYVNYTYGILSSTVGKNATVTYKNITSSFSGGNIWHGLQASSVSGDYTCNMSGFTSGYTLNLSGMTLGSSVGGNYICNIGADTEDGEYDITGLLVYAYGTGSYYGSSTTQMTIGKTATISIKNICATSSVVNAYGTTGFYVSNEDEEEIAATVTIDNLYANNNIYAYGIYAYTSAAYTGGSAIVSITNVDSSNSSAYSYARAVYAQSYAIGIAGDLTATIKDFAASYGATSGVEASSSSYTITVNGDAKVTIDGGAGALKGLFATTVTGNANVSASNVKDPSGNTWYGIYSSTIYGTVDIDISDCSGAYYLYTLSTSSVNVAVGDLDEGEYATNINVSNLSVSNSLYGIYTSKYNRSANVEIKDCVCSSYTSSGYLYGIYTGSGYSITGDANIVIDGAKSYCIYGYNGSDSSVSTSAETDYDRTITINNSVGTYAIYGACRVAATGDLTINTDGNSANLNYDAYYAYALGDLTINAKNFTRITSTTVTNHSTYYCTYYGSYYGGINITMDNIDVMEFLGCTYSYLYGGEDNTLEMNVSNSSFTYEKLGIAYSTTKSGAISIMPYYGNSTDTIGSINATFKNCTIDNSEYADTTGNTPYVIWTRACYSDVYMDFIDCDISGTYYVEPDTIESTGCAIINVNDDRYYGGVITLTEDVEVAGDIYIGTVYDSYTYRYAASVYTRTISLYSMAAVCIPEGVTVKANNIYPAYNSGYSSSYFLHVFGTLDANIDCAIEDKLGHVFVNSSATITDDTPNANMYYEYSSTVSSEGCTIALTITGYRTRFDTDAYANVLAGSTPKYTVTLDSGYNVVKSTYTDGDSTLSMTVDDDVYSFVMPYSTTQVYLLVSANEMSSDVEIDEDQQTILLNGNSVVIEESTSGTAVYLDEDMDGAADSDEALIDGDLSSYTIYGYQACAAESQLLITMYSGNVGAIYGSDSSTVSSTEDGDIITIEIKGGTVGKAYAMAGGQIEGTLVLIISDDATVSTAGLDELSGTYVGAYVRMNGSAYFYGTYETDRDIEAENLSCGGFPANIVLNGDITLTGKLSAGSPTSSAYGYLTLGGTVTASTMALSSYSYLTIAETGKVTIEGDVTNAGYTSISIYGELEAANITYSGSSVSAEIYVYEKGSFTTEDIALSSYETMYVQGSLVINGTPSSSDGKILVGENAKVSGDGVDGTTNLYYLAKVDETTVKGTTPTLSGTYCTSYDMDGDGTTEDYIKKNSTFKIKYTEISGYVTSARINDEDPIEGSSGSISATMPEGTAVISMIYDATQITVSASYSEISAVAGKEYTTAKALCSLTTLNVENDCAEAYGSARTYKVVSGSLPDGLSLDESTGKITGTATTEDADGTEVTFQVTGCNGTTATIAITFIVLPEGTVVSDINEMVDVDTTAATISLNGVSVVIVSAGDDLTSIYLDNDRDGVADNSTALEIDGEGALDLSTYAIYGYNDSDTEYNGDIRITMYGGTVYEIRGVKGTSSNNTTVNGSVTFDMRGGAIKYLYFVIQSYIDGDVNILLSGGTLGFGASANLFGAYYATITGDLNVEITGGFTTNTGSGTSSIYLADASTVSGDVNALVGLDDTALPTYSYFEGFYQSTAGGDFNIEVNGNWKPYENIWLYLSQISGAMNVNLTSGTFTNSHSTSKPTYSSLIKGSNSVVGGDITVLIAEDTTFSGYFAIIYTASEVGNIKYVYPESASGSVTIYDVYSSCSSYRSNTGTYIYNNGAVTFKRTCTLTEDVSATTCLVYTSASLTLTDGVKLTASGTTSIYTGGSVTLEGNSSLTLEGQLSAYNAVTLDVGEEATATMKGVTYIGGSSAAATVNNKGTLNISGAFTMYGTFVNDGYFNLTGSSAALYANTTNNGDMNIATSSSTHIKSGYSFANNGLLSVYATFICYGTNVNGEDGQIYIDDCITFQGTTTNNGTITGAEDGALVINGPFTNNGSITTTNESISGFKFNGSPTSTSGTTLFTNNEGASITVAGMLLYCGTMYNYGSFTQTGGTAEMSSPITLYTTKSLTWTEGLAEKYSDYIYYATTVYYEYGTFEEDSPVTVTASSSSDYATIDGTTFVKGGGTVNLSITGTLVDDAVISSISYTDSGETKDMEGSGTLFTATMPLDITTFVINIEGVEAHVHEYTSEVTKEATCSAMGETTYTCVCGDSYISVNIDKIDHTIEFIAATAATCTETGLTAGSKCSVCGEIIVEQEEVEATGHTVVTDEASEASCTVVGLTEGSHCSVCGEILEAQEEIPATGHTVVVDEAVAASCETSGLTEGSHCSVCNSIITEQEVVAATGHSWNEGSVTTENSCSSDGEKTYTCTICGETKTEAVTAFGHTVVTDEAVVETCTTDGKTAGSHCSVCGTVIVAQETISATGHTAVTDEAVDATCTTTGLTEGSHCSVCNETIVAQEVIPATGHTVVVDEAVAESCDTSGLTEGSHCSVCGDIIVAQEVVPAIGHHTYTEPYYEGEYCSQVYKEVCTYCGEVNIIATYADNHNVVTVDGKEPTCTEDGYTSYSYCSVCDAIIEKQETISATGHSYVTDEAVAATCSTTGLTEGSHCEICGEIKVAQVTVPTTDHTEVTVEAQAATCTENGHTAYSYCSVCDEIIIAKEIIEATGHNYKDGGKESDGSCGLLQTYVCAVCGDSYSEAADGVSHTGETVTDEGYAATCTETGLTDGSHCSACNAVITKQEIIPALGHTEAAYDEVEATCTETGFTGGTYCSVCNEVLTSRTVVAATGHTIATDDAVAATCTATGLTAGSHCSVCNETIVAQEVVEAKGHSYDAGVVTTEATVTSKGVMTYTCTVCGASYTEDIDELDPSQCTHPNPTLVTGTSPTCTETGLTAGYYCEDCGTWTLAQETVTATGHTYKASEAKAATCDEAGYVIYICADCGDEYNKTLDATGHTEVNVAATEPTCTETGLTAGVQCSECEEWITAQEVIPATGHSLGEGVVAVEPGCITTGEMHYTCSVCGEVVVESIDATGHTVVVDPAVAATCTETGLAAGSHCSVCGKVIKAQTETPAEGHTWDDGVTQKNASCGEYTVYTCVVCDETMTESNGTNHTETAYPEVAATCTESGYTGGTYCSVCGSTLTERTIVAATGHTEVVDEAVAATCTEDGLTEGSHCSVCNVTITPQETVSATGHTWNENPASSTGEYCSLVYTYNCEVCDETKTVVDSDIKSHTIVTDDAVAATCTSTGLTAGSHCSVCGAIIKEQEVVAALGHNEVTIAATAATCTETGLTEGSYCNVCGETIVQQTVTEATGHIVITDLAVDPTCTESGLTEGSHCKTCGEVLVAQKVVEATGHTWDEGVTSTSTTCGGAVETVFTCTDCGYTMTTVEGTKSHTITIDLAVAATCTEDGLTEGSHCSECGAIIVAQETISATGHTLVTDEAVEATCTSTGLTEGEHCSICGTVTKAQTEIAAIAHTVVTDSAVAATCIDDGLTEGSHCSVCGEVLVAQETVAALGHDGHVYEVVEDLDKYCGIIYIYTCTVCGEQEEVATDETAHTPDDILSGYAATCTSSGLTDGVKCSACGVWITQQEIIDPIDHTVVIDEAVVATCTETGLTEGSHCSECNTVIVSQKVVAATGHTIETLVAVSPTCTSTGLTAGSQCSVCQEILVAQETVAATGHTEVADEAVAATCTESGLTAGAHCSICGVTTTAQEIIQPIGHNYTETGTDKSTCGVTVTTYKCERCDSEITKSEGTAGHANTTTLDDAVEATCTTTGLTATVVCEDCGAVIEEQQVVAATDHKQDIVLDSVESTCITTGLTTGYKCSACGEVVVAQEDTQVIAHNYIGVVTKAATTTSYGIMTYTCSMCGKSFKETIDMLDDPTAEDPDEPEVTTVPVTDDIIEAVITAVANGTYTVAEGGTLGDITLPTTTYGTYCWAEGDSTVVSDGSTYIITFVPDPDSNLDWSAVDGYDKETGTVSIEVTVRTISSSSSDNTSSSSGSSSGNGSSTTTTTTDSSTTTEESTEVGNLVAGSKFTVGTTNYMVNSDGTVTVTGITTSATDKSVTSLTILNEVIYGGVTYKVSAIGESAFSGYKYLTTVHIGDNVTTIAARAFKDCTSLKTVTGCKNVVTIGKQAFANDKSLVSVAGCTKLKTIGASAFSKCTKLKTLGNKKNTITLPSVVTIKKKAFFKCTSLVKVNATSKQLVSIGAKAFEGCKSLKKFVSKSKKLKKIGKRAFYNCKKLKRVVLKTTKLTSKNVLKNAFKNIKATCTFKVPKAKKSDYKKLFKLRGAKSTIKVK